VFFITSKSEQKITVTLLLPFNRKNNRITSLKNMS
ncbi:MAG: hypothetical protein ACI9JY_003171, partial [Saprospiraceae bacterium]